MYWFLCKLDIACHRGSWN